MLRGGDARAFLGALEAQLALVVALVQIADGWHDISSFEGLPDAVVGRDLGAVRGQGECGVGAKIGGDFLGAHLVHIQSIGFERGIGGFESGLDLSPRSRACWALAKCAEVASKRPATPSRAEKGRIVSYTTLRRVRHGENMRRMIDVSAEWKRIRPLEEGDYRCRPVQDVAASERGGDLAQQNAGRRN